VSLEYETRNAGNTSGTSGKSKYKPKVYYNLMVEKYDSFEDIIYSEKMNIYLVHKYLYQIAEAVEFLHTKHITHTDVRTSNILYDADEDIIKLIDFSTARYIKHPPVYYKVGSRNYLPPELIDPLEGDAEENITYPVDVWMFGCLIFKILTGEYLFNFPKKYDDNSCSRSSDYEYEVFEYHRKLIKKLFQKKYNNIYGALVKKCRYKLDRSEYQYYTRLICQCLSMDASKRPKMKEVRESLNRQLVVVKEKYDYCV
jgi:serine/threonine protein kinase